MTRDELAGWLRLTLTPGVGNDTARRLLAAFGLPDAIFAQPTAALLQLATARQVKALHTEPDKLQTLLDTTWAWLTADSAGAGERRVTALGDNDYPAQLLTLADPPLMLYLQGMALTADATRHAIAMVGSRNPTPQGTSNAHAFAQAMGMADVPVVSGLALGVDGAAHRGALAGAAPGSLATIAVVGTGLDRVYPSRHRELAHAIAQRGTLVSEYPLGTPPLAPNFPKRNRLVAGLSRGTLVVEAALQSGSLITAQQALEQGKDVFAIPGSIHSPQSRGCHHLIKQGAKLVESAADILDEWGMGPQVGTATLFPDSADEATPGSLLSAMGFDPVSLDALMARTGESTAQLQAQLLALELEGQVALLPGGLFQRIGRA